MEQLIQIVYIWVAAQVFVSIVGIILAIRMVDRVERPITQVSKVINFTNSTFVFR